jgi:hypothetical protein
MEELDKKFIEPVVLGRLPFRMLGDVAREAVANTHRLVMELTAHAVVREKAGDADAEAPVDSGTAVASTR